MSSVALAVGTVSASNAQQGARVAGAFAGAGRSLWSFATGSLTLIVIALLLSGFNLLFVPSQSTLLTTVKLGKDCANEAFRSSALPLLRTQAELSQPYLCYANAVTWTVLRGLPSSLTDAYAECGGLQPWFDATANQVRVFAGDIIRNQTLSLEFLANGFDLTAFEAASRAQSAVARNLTLCVCADLEPVLTPFWDAYDSDAYWSALECTINSVALFPRFLFAAARDVIDNAPTIEQPRFNRLRALLCCASTQWSNVLFGLLQDFSDSFTGTFDSLPASEIGCIIGNTLCTAGAAFALTLQAAFNAAKIARWPVDSYYKDSFRPEAIRLFNLIGEPIPALDPRLSFPALAAPTFLAGGGYDPSTFIRDADLAFYTSGGAGAASAFGQRINSTRLNECACGFLSSLFSDSDDPSIQAFDPCPILGIFDTAADALGWLLDSAFNFFQLPAWAHFWDLRWLERPFTSTGFLAVIPSFWTNTNPALALGLSQMLAGYGLLVFSLAEVLRVGVMAEDAFGFLRSETGSAVPQIRCSLTATTACNVRETVDAALLITRTGLGTTCQGLSDAVSVDITGLCCAPQQAIVGLRSIWLLVHELLQALSFGDPDNVSTQGDTLQTQFVAVVRNIALIPRCSCPLYRTLLTLLATLVDVTVDGFTIGNDQAQQDISIPIQGVDNIRTGIFKGINLLFQAILPEIGRLCELLFTAAADVLAESTRMIISVIINFSRDGIVGGYFLDGGRQPGTDRRLFSPLDYTEMLREANQVGKSDQLPQGRLDPGADLQRLSAAVVRLAFVPVQLLNLVPILDGGEVLFLQQTFSLSLAAQWRFFLRPWFKAAQGDFGYFTDFQRGLNRSVYWRLTSPWISDIWRMLDVYSEAPGTANQRRANCQVIFYPNGGALFICGGNVVDGPELALPDASTYTFDNTTYPIDRPGLFPNRPAESAIDSNRLLANVDQSGTPQLPWTFVNAAQVVAEAVLPGPWANALFCPVRAYIRIVAHVMIGFPVELAMRLTLGVGGATSPADFFGSVFTWISGTPNPLAASFDQGWRYAQSMAPYEEVAMQIDAFFSCACGILINFTVGPAVCLCDAGALSIYSTDGSTNVGILDGIGETISMIMLIIVGLMRDALNFQISITDNIVIPVGTLLASVLNQATCLPRKLIGLLPGLPSAEQWLCTSLRTRTNILNTGERIELARDLETTFVPKSECDDACIRLTEAIRSTVFRFPIANGVFELRSSYTCVTAQSSELDIKFMAFTNALNAVLMALPLLVSDIIDAAFDGFINTDRVTFNGGVSPASYNGLPDLDNTRPAQECRSACVFLGQTEYTVPAGKYENTVDVECDCESIKRAEAYRNSGRRTNPNAARSRFNGGEDTLLVIILGIVAPILDLIVAFFEVLETITSPVPGLRDAMAVVAKLFVIARDVMLTIVALAYRLLMVFISFMIEMFDFRPLKVDVDLRYGAFGAVVGALASIDFPLLDLVLQIIDIIVDAVNGRLYDKSMIKTQASFAAPLSIPKLKGQNSFRRRSDAPAPRETRESRPRVLDMAQCLGGPAALAQSRPIDSPSVLRACLCQAAGRRMADMAQGAKEGDMCDAGQLGRQGMATPFDVMRTVAQRWATWSDVTLPVETSAAPGQAAPDGRSGATEASLMSCEVRVEMMASDADAWADASAWERMHWVDCVQRRAAAVDAVHATFGQHGPMPHEWVDQSWTQTLSRKQAVAMQQGEQQRRKLDAFLATIGGHSHSRARAAPDSAGADQPEAPSWQDEVTVAGMEDVPIVQQWAFATRNTTPIDDHESDPAHRRQRSSANTAKEQPSPSVVFPTTEEIRAAKVRFIERILPQTDADTQAWLRGQAEHPPDLESRPHGKLLARLSKWVVPWINVHDAHLWGVRPGSNATADEFGRATCDWLDQPADQRSPAPPVDPQWLASGTRLLPGGTPQATCNAWRSRAHVRSRAVRPRGHHRLSRFGTRYSTVLADATEGANPRSARLTSHAGTQAAHSRHRSRSARARRKLTGALAAERGHWLGVYQPPVAGEAPMRVIDGMPHVRLARSAKPVRSADRMINGYAKRRVARAKKVGRALRDVGVLGQSSPLAPHHQRMVADGCKAIDHVMHTVLSGAMTKVVVPAMFTNTDPRTNMPRATAPRTATEAATSTGSPNAMLAAMAWVYDTGNTVRRVWDQLDRSPDREARRMVDGEATQATIKKIYQRGTRAMEQAVQRQRQSASTRSAAAPEEHSEPEAFLGVDSVVDTLLIEKAKQLGYKWNTTVVPSAASGDPKPATRHMVRVSTRAPSAHAEETHTADFRSAREQFGIRDHTPNARWYMPGWLHFASTLTQDGAAFARMAWSGVSQGARVVREAAGGASVRRALDQHMERILRDQGGHARRGSPSEAPAAHNDPDTKHGAAWAWARNLFGSDRHSQPHQRERAARGADDANTPSAGQQPTLPWWTSMAVDWWADIVVNPSAPHLRQLRAQQQADFRRSNSTAYLWWSQGPEVAMQAKEERTTGLTRARLRMWANESAAAAASVWADDIAADPVAHERNMRRHRRNIHSAARMIFAGDSAPVDVSAQSLSARLARASAAAKRTILCPKCDQWRRQAVSNLHKQASATPAQPFSKGRFAARRSHALSKAITATDREHEAREQRSIQALRMMAKLSDAVWHDHPEGITARMQRRLQQVGAESASPLSRHANARNGTSWGRPLEVLDHWRMRQWVWRMRLYENHRQRTQMERAELMATTARQQRCGSRFAGGACQHHTPNAHAHVRDWLLGPGCRVFDILLRDSTRFFEFCGQLNQEIPTLNARSVDRLRGADWKQRSRMRSIASFATAHAWTHPDGAKFNRTAVPSALTELWQKGWHGAPTRWRRSNSDAFGFTYERAAEVGATKGKRCARPDSQLEASREGTTKLTILPVLDAVCAVFDGLFGSNFQGAVNDFVADAAELAANPKTDGDLDDRGLAGYLLFHAECPAIDSITCNGGVGLRQAVEDSLPYVGYTALIMFVLQPVAPLILIIAAPLYGAYIITHAWRYPLSCVLALQVPLCMFNDLVDIAETVFPECDESLWRWTGMVANPREGSTCVPCGVRTRFVDCAQYQEAQLWGNLLYFVTKFVPSLCTYGRVLPGFGETCDNLNVGSGSAASDLADRTGVAKRRAGCAAYNISLSLLALILLYLTIGVVAIGVVLVVSVGMAALGAGAANAAVLRDGSISEVVTTGGEASDALGVPGAGFAADAPVWQ